MKKTFLLIGQIFAIIAAVFFLGYVAALAIYYVVVVLGGKLDYISHDIRYNMVIATITLIIISVLFIVLGVLNIVAAVKISKVRRGLLDKNKILGWGIFMIFGSFVIGGVFTLLAIFSEEVTNSFSPSNYNNSLEKKLVELQALYDKQLITKEEYENRRKRILETE